MQAHTHTAPMAAATATGHLRIPRIKLRALFPDGLPAEAYGLILEGGCLEPMASDGDMVLASPSTSARVGDLVVVLDQHLQLDGGDVDGECRLR